MTTLEELDGGLGSCEAGGDLSALADPCPGQPGEDKARAAAIARLTDLSGRPHGTQEPEAEGRPMGDVDTKPKRTEKEPQVKGAPSPGKERPKAGATPRSAPARKKAQSAPPPQPPPPPPAASEELPWADLTLNQCLVLASLLALLGSAVQLCRDAVAGEATVPAPAPEPWVPPSTTTKERERPLQKPAAWAPTAKPPAPQVEAKERPDAPGDGEAAEKSGEASGEDDAPLADPGPREKPPGREWRKEARPRKERPRKEERPRREGRPRKEERPRAASEPRGMPPRRWEARAQGRRPLERGSGDPERKRRPGRASPGSPAEEDRPPGRQPRRAGQGRA